ncbi:GNAT family N-acetyltransferase [Albidovulum sp.]|uniref:GNAT family N-acetyltransferase n=1 Tax=Albidovulum sp. TaxID=1872424 RepID=UPI001DC8CD77|nr:GNAT family N-acetyltransferase [Paracoccaceae bacterium]MCB2158017.1 GNAT family N-acetyltransferase [Paracoccaceae bacterium]MCP5355846.1 GNAT family N-acetyltransferase [Paracoccaceae bacterium]HPE24944.1 GNAT family N-acyltransferase [Albidovulum sp.]
MTALERGRYAARLAEGPGDLAAVLALRARAFRDGADDRDPWDARCLHLLVENRGGGPVAAACRLLLLPSGADFAQSYSAQFYEVDGMSALSAPVAEVGRLCTAPGLADPDPIRLLWGALTGLLGARGVGCLFGCTSFRGGDPARHRPALDLLAGRHLLQPPWQVRARRAGGVRLRSDGDRQGDGAEGAAMAWQGIPPLLRAYLAMGGRVGQEAVIDRDLDTLHVFTLVDVAAMPAGRLAALQALAGRQ